MTISDQEKKSIQQREAKFNVGGEGKRGVAKKEAGGDIQVFPSKFICGVHT